MLGIAVPVFNSCSKDFLKEELTTSLSTDYFETNEGLESLSVGIYAGTSATKRLTVPSTMVPTSTQSVQMRQTVCGTTMAHPCRLP